MTGLTLHRTLHLTNPLMRGPDVHDVQELLTTKGFRVAADSVFGPQTAGECVAAKKKLGYPVAEQIPVCGQRLVNRLEEYRPQRPDPPAGLTARERYVELLHWAIDHADQWHYAEIRPIPVHLPPKTLPVTTDCSGSVTLLAKWAQLPDPNGRNFDGLGYTGSILDHCQHITRAMLQPGDLVVFGRYPGHHVCAALNVDTDPLLFSHGSEPDPRAISLSAETAAQARYGANVTTYLRFINAPA